ncbi:MAG: ATP-binding cassette domain-containing protein [Clostridia bacterium]|nr:ATP-binding cassette domain-containing protein [Clostridia bacterium]
MKAVEVKNLSKSFKTRIKEKGLKGSLKSLVKSEYEIKKAVNDITFDVEEGEIVAFLGPNGAGKSTTIKMLTGILERDEGDIKIMGIDPSTDRKKLAKSIGTVFGQKEQLWTHLTPYDNFKFFGSIYDVPDDEVEERIKEFNELFELDDIMNTPVRNLSLGQRIRCEIIASLIHKPKILFLDEPTIGLDPIVKDKIRYLIKKMNKEYNLTIFLTSHDIGDIQKLCERIIIINNGEIVTDDSMMEIRRKYFTKKIIKLRTNCEVDFVAKEGIDILKREEEYLKLSLDLKCLNVTDIFHLIPENEISDISVSDVSLESVIKEIYQSN